MSRPDKDPSPSEITPERLYLRRREFIRNAALFGAPSAAVGGSLLWLMNGIRADPRPGAGSSGGKELTIARPGTDSTDETPTPYDDVTTYNNFYEFGTDKGDPAEYAGALRPRPWTVRIDGEVERPRTVDIDELLGWFPLEERIYRMRCVEAWSMVIPWVGFPLGALLDRVGPTSRAKYVAFTSLLDPEQMPGQRRAILDWPYVEGLRIDEAMHALTLLAAGLYGKVLPNQNGAPLRLVVTAPHARSLRLLLRGAARGNLHRARPGTRLARHLGRRHQAQVHLRGLRRVRPAPAARRHLDQRRPEAARLRALEAAAPAGVRRADAGGDPLHLAREEGRLGARSLCHCPWRVAAGAARDLRARASGDGFSSNRFTSGVK
jgi:methionine sulfoxide reductase catalytic subunit